MATVARGQWVIYKDEEGEMVALVTAVNPENDLVNLCAFKPSGETLAVQGVDYSAEPDQGSYSVFASSAPSS